MRGRPWTAEEDALMRQHAVDGKSYTDVAKAMGRSRSAVAGRADRQGIGFHGPLGNPKGGFSSMSPEQLRETARKGGLRSARVRWGFEPTECAPAVQSTEALRFD